MAASAARRERRANLRGRHAALQAMILRETLEECFCIHHVEACDRCKAIDRQLGELESIARAR